MLSGDVAYQIQNVAVAWHVFTLHHRALDLGLVGLALFLPTFVFALPAGVFADRHDRRKIVVGMGLIEARCALAFIGAVVTHVTALPAYLGILAVVGTARAFGVPAERSILPAIVPPHEFMRAQATYSALRQIAIIGGPAVGGALVAFSTPLAFAVAIVALAGYVVALGSLHVERVPRPDAPATWRDAFEGLRFVRRQPIIAGAITLDLFAVLFGGATALLPAFADGIFHAGPQGLGALRSAPAVGAAIVAAIVARRPLRRHVGRTLLVAVAGFGLATIGFGLSRSFVLSLAMLAIVGGTDMVSVVIRSNLVQLATPDGMRGRVNAVENIFIGASNELGEFESGSLAALIGVVPSVVAGGLGTLAIIALCGAFFPALRRADRFDVAPKAIA
ncbi:MAG: MFS transporter [Candidatus Eremiobacteraeota bacterium]|nr:MFS transporter [Candidatus Eremiobacteraeota bacterium]